ncbi:MAG: hypothetical protein U5K37_04575 [Natrialbaceae archaeon]|nr:hypothetical protein [Natrialbaceae archaeon]
MDAIWPEEADSQPEEIESSDPGAGQLDEGATQVVRAYFDAMSSGDAEEVNALIHPEKNTTISPVQLRPFQNASISINAISVQQSDEDSAILRVDTRLEDEIQSSTSTDTIEVKKYDGTWYIWGHRKVAHPQVSLQKKYFETFWEAINQGEFVLANSLVHPDSPEGTISVNSESEWNKRTIVVREVEGVEHSSDSAIVRIVMDWSMETEKGPQETTLDLEYELRQSGGEWRLWKQHQN